MLKTLWRQTDYKQNLKLEQHLGCIIKIATLMMAWMWCMDLIPIHPQDQVWSRDHSTTRTVPPTIPGAMFPDHPPDGATMKENTMGTPILPTPDCPGCILQVIPPTMTIPHHSDPADTSASQTGKRALSLPSLAPDTPTLIPPCKYHRVMSLSSSSPASNSLLNNQKKIEQKIERKKNWKKKSKWPTKKSSFFRGGVLYLVFLS